LTSEPQPASAQNAAIAVAAKNSVMGTAVTLAPADVVVDTTLRRVTVTVNRNIGGSPINTFFAGALGISQMGTQAKAVAEASTQATGSRCVKPIYIPNTALTTINPPRADSACNATPKQIIFDPTTKAVTAWAQTRVGSQIQIHPPGGTASTASQYQALDFGNGGSTYRCTWGKCLNDPSCGASASVLKCGTSYPIETGAMTGPTKQGVQDLIGNPVVDSFKAIDQYKNISTGTVSDSSRALVTAPVWDNCNNPISPGTNGQTAQILGFVKIFVDSVAPNADVQAHVISEIQCDANASTSTSTGPFAIPIRLVQVP
jgi:hypothetical protein